MGDTWHRQERPIGNAVRSSSSGVDSHPTVRSSSHRGRLGIARSSSDGRDRSWSWRRMWSYQDHKISIEQRRKLVEELHDRGAIEPRSRCNRAAIVAPLAWNRSDDSPTWSDGERLMTRITIDVRSWPDRGTIVARSWRDRGPFEAKIETNLPQIREPRHRPRESLPRPCKTASTIASNGLKIGPNFPFKNPCILPLFLNFWSIREEINRILRKISSSSWSPAFRLDCKAIGVGLIANFSLISSNFPLEFQTSARKNRSKFASIHENWSPILAKIGLVVRFDRLSGGNLSFY